MLTIISKEVLQACRDVKTLLIMIFMPTVLTLILGITFKQTFNNTIDLSQVNVRYILNCNDDEKKVFSEFVNVAKELNMNIQQDTKEVNSNREGVKSVIHSYDEDIYRSNTITMEVNSLDNIKISYDKKITSQGTVVMSLLDTFLDRYKAIGSTISNGGNMELIKEVLDKNFINIKSLSGKKTPTSMDYYGVVMITMTIMFGAVTGAYGIIKERDSNTLGKILSSSVSSGKILFGKLFGASLIVFIQAFMVLIISNLIGVFWGKNIISVLFILYSEGILAVALGISLGYFIKDNKSAWMVLLLIIMTIGFLGGAFIPLDMMESELINNISILSPLTYINKSVFNVIYNGTTNLANLCIMLNTLIAVTLVTFTGFIMEVKK